MSPGFRIVHPGLCKASTRGFIPITPEGFRNPVRGGRIRAPGGVFGTRGKRTRGLPFGV
jgi:hypothetical protein